MKPLNNMPSAWVQETEYQELKLFRPPLGSQLRVFQRYIESTMREA